MNKRQELINELIKADQDGTYKTYKSTEEIKSMNIVVCRYKLAKTAFRTIGSQAQQSPMIHGYMCRELREAM